MPDLERRIDDLYKGPPDAFVAARGLLAKELRGEDGRRVKALAKPTIVPWAVNQLHWRRRATYDRLVAAGQRLRTAQLAALGGSPADLAAVTRAHRQAVVDAARAAIDLASAAGAKVDGEALARMFEAVSLAADLAEPHGRFTRLLQPAGFEALAGVSVRAPDERAAGRPQTDSTREDWHLKAEEERLRAERQQPAAARAQQAALERAEAALSSAREEETRAKSAWEASRQRAAEAERTLANLRRSTNQAGRRPV